MEKKKTIFQVISGITITVIGPLLVLNYMIPAWRYTNEWDPWVVVPVILIILLLLTGIGLLSLRGERLKKFAIALFVFFKAFH